MSLKTIAIARVCHEANRAWCKANGDNTQKTWWEVDQSVRDSSVRGVEFRVDNPDAGPDAQHNAWMEERTAQGWRYGEEKNAHNKTHPCLVPFDKLPEFQQQKDKLFCAIVEALK